MIGGPVALDSLIKMEVANNSQEIKDGHELHYEIHDRPLLSGILSPVESYLFLVNSRRV